METPGDEIRFISKARGKGRSFNIPLHIASSSARGLSDFYFFLRHVASSNHLLIVDEPESHLDTANQILLARLLARFVRAGLKVLITTHSDYLIKEINNLVMLNSTFAEKESVVKNLKYRLDDALEPESIRAYVAENNELTRCVVDQFGIDMPVFDETIDKINEVANELASRISEDSGGGGIVLSSQLKTILAENALVSYETGSEVILREELTELAVTQMPSDVTVVDMDVVGHLPGVDGGVLKWICDYLLVSDSKDTDHAIFVELKETLRENNKGREQLRRSLPILTYLDFACQIHNYEPKKNRPASGVRYFLIGKKNSPRLDNTACKTATVCPEGEVQGDRSTYLPGSTNSVQSTAQRRDGTTTRPAKTSAFEGLRRMLDGMAELKHLRSDW